MATWKKIIVSGSQAELAGVTGSFTGSFIGDGSSLTGVSGEFPSTFKSGISYDATKFFVNDGASKFVSGSQVAAYVFGEASDSGDATIGADGGITINSDSVENSMLANMTRGTVKVGGNSNAPTDLDAKTDGQILVGDGTDINSVAVSGDITLANNGAVTIANDAVETAMIAHSLGTLGTHQFTGSFSGSFTGDGSGLTGVTGEVNIDALDALGGTGLHQTQDHFIFSDNGTEKKITFSNLQDAVFADVSSDATIAAGGALTIANDAVNNNKLANIARGSVKVGGGSNAPTDLDAKGDGKILVGDGTDINSVAVSGDITLANDGAVTIAANAVEGSMLNSNVAGTGLDYGSNQLSVDVSDFLDNGANNRVITATGTDGLNAESNLTFNGSTLALSGAMTISTNLTVSGNLTVTGDTIEQQVTNLNVEDKFILLNSGSSTVGDEAGIIFGGSHDGTAYTGSALIWNGDYNGNDGRLAVANNVASNATTATVAYYVGGVFLGNTTNAATAQADHPGNIRIESDEIYIYV